MISIIIATYNSAETIGKTLRSLQTQTRKDFELVFVDGQSKDDTLEIIREHQKTFENNGVQVSVISEKDKGIYDAFNKGVKKANGEWLSFLGSDDWLIDDRVIEKCIRALEESEKYDWVCTGFQYPKTSKKRNIEFPKAFDWGRFKSFMSLPHPGSFHNKDYFLENGLFDTEFKIAGDYEILLRKKDKIRVKCLGFNTVVMSEDGVSNSQIAKTLLESFKAQRKNRVGGTLFLLLSAFRFTASYLKRKLTG